MICWAAQDFYFLFYEHLYYKTKFSFFVTRLNFLFYLITMIQ
uniref:Uncharacterized protein n=1 Tax=Anguilla anguilla TaxID=7936 RepID=A0A0E9RZG7_ANGAN